MKQKLLSRKFLTAVGTAIFIALNDALDLKFSQEAINGIITLVVGWIAVEGATDLAASVKKKPVEVSVNDSKALDTVRQDSEGA